MKFWKCWFFHDWSKWSDKFEMKNNFGTYFFVHYRTCARCGAIGRRRL